MNLNKLFEAQRKLDERIVKEKGLENEDLLDKKILALQVELGELANEYRGFKFWSENPKPNIKAKRLVRLSKNEFSYGYVEYNPLLEEYVDCLHFILSIGNDLGLRVTSCEYDEFLDLTEREISITRQFIVMNLLTSLLLDEPKTDYHTLVFEHITLGEMLGFTWKEIEQAYFEKNKVNHERQESGY